MEANFNWWCNTFVPVGKTTDQLTLGDITVDPSEFKFSSIDFLDQNGSGLLFDDPDVGKGVLASYTYWTAEDATAGVAGWYLVEDTNAEYPRNSRVMQLGESYIAVCYSGEEGAQLTFNGEVCKESMTYKLTENYNWLGNCAPADITLGDITVDPSEFKFSSIDFLDQNGSGLLFDDPDVGKGVLASYTYWTAGDATAGVAGWYLVEDTSAEYPRNSRVVPSGSAFIAVCYSGEEGAVFTLPSAL